MSDCKTHWQFDRESGGISWIGKPGFLFVFRSISLSFGDIYVWQTNGQTSADHYYSWPLHCSRPANNVSQDMQGYLGEEKRKSCYYCGGLWAAERFNHRRSKMNTRYIEEACQKPADDSRSPYRLVAGRRCYQSGYLDNVCRTWALLWWGCLV